MKTYQVIKDVLGIFSFVVLVMQLSGMCTTPFWLVGQCS